MSPRRAACSSPSPTPTPIRASKRSAQWCLQGIDRCWAQKVRAIRPAERTEAEQEQRARIRQVSRRNDDRDHYCVRQLTTAELERAKRELQANLGLITSDSPARVPIQNHMRAIDAELAERVDGRQPSGVLP